jgi:hypothetical protein
MKTKLILISILSLVFISLSATSATAKIRHYLNWGAICGNTSTDFGQGACTSMLINDSNTGEEYTCDDTDAVCITIGQDPDEGSWYVDYSIGGVPSPLDQSYLFSFDYVNQEPVITPIGPVAPD